MIPALVSLALVTATMAVGSPSSAREPCTIVTSTTIVQGKMQTKSVRSCTGENEAGSATSTLSTPTVGPEACQGILAGLNASANLCAALPPELATVTPTLVSSALKRLRLPSSTLVVQPPNGRTLVNFATNFYTEREEFTRNVRLLGQRIELRITPSRFTWHFDDGESTTTTSPGTPYPDLEVTHDYLDKGAVSPSVDTTYTAEFRVGGGSWQPVPGSVTIPGEAVALEVVEASPILVGYN